MCHRRGSCRFYFPYSVIWWRASDSQSVLGHRAPIKCIGKWAGIPGNPPWTAFKFDEYHCALEKFYPYFAQSLPVKNAAQCLVSYSRPFVNVNVDDRHRRAEHAEKHHDREQR